MNVFNNFNFSSFLFTIAFLNVIPVLGQSIQIRESPANCYSTTVQTFNFASSSGSPLRNTYTGTNSNGGNPMRVIWVAGSNRWEIQQDFGGFLTDYYSTLASRPNPPSLSAGNWQQDAACAGGTLVQFNGTGTQTVLPVELTQFDVHTEGSKNILNWVTASENDNKGFDIERSIDGNTFHTFAQVKGNNKPSSYQYVDKVPFNTTYYRLRQVDYDGTTTYSKVISMTLYGMGKGLKVSPNPVSLLLTINTEGGDFQILNLLGQQVLRGKTAQQIDVSALPTGTYVIKVGAEQAKFVKQ